MSSDPVAIFDRLVPEPARHGDWEDVLRRAGVRRSRRALAVGAVALALVVAAPAFALLLDVIGRKDVTFSKAPHASNRIKKRFYDLGGGVPPRQMIGALAGQTRLAGTLRFGGKLRRLWVVPTKRGGYCYLLEGYGGGCAPNRPNSSSLVNVGWSFSQSFAGRWRWQGGGGVVNSSRVWRLEFRLSGGRTVPVPFIWVSKPIAAGFFGFAAPRNRSITAIAAYDRSGHLLERQATPGGRPGPIRIPPGHVLRVKPRRLAVSPPVAPTPPVQRAIGDGMAVVAGANGSILFHAVAVPPSTRHVFAGGASYSCFRLTREFGIFDTRGYGVSGAFAPSVGFRFFGIGGRLDGCEVGGFGGHRWPDRFGSHTPVEVPLTNAGRRYFADRAAARDLAAFVRARRVQMIRKEAPGAMGHDLDSLYGALLARHGIRFTLTRTGVVFEKSSDTGKRFRVVVRRGRIARQNLSPYAFVF